MRYLFLMLIPLVSFASSDDSLVIRSFSNDLKETKGDSKIKIDYGFSPSVPTNLNSSNPHNEINIELHKKNDNDSSMKQYVYEGYDAAMTGHTEAALQLYKQALALDESNVYILYTIGTLYHKLGQFSQAKIYYKKVLQSSKHHKKALINFIAVVGEEDPKDAIQELKNLIKINPNYSPLFGQLGVIYAKLDSFSEAETNFQKAIILAPQEVLYQFNLAVMYDKLGRYKAARKLYYDVLNSESKYLPESRDSIQKRIDKIQNYVVNAK